MFWEIMRKLVFSKKLRFQEKKQDGVTNQMGYTITFTVQAAERLLVWCLSWWTQNGPATGHFASGSKQVFEDAEKKLLLQIPAVKRGIS